MSETDDVAGVFAEIDTEAAAHTPVEKEDVDTTPKGEGAESTTATPKLETKKEEVEAPSAGQPAEGQPQTEATPTETTEPSQDKQTTEEVDNWQSRLPAPPAPYRGPVPQIDKETGQILNMTAEEYSTYMRESTMAAWRQELYEDHVENASLDAAEKILPEIKTNQAIRTMVENARVASIILGKSIDAYTAAKQVREALGIAPAKLQQAKAEGAQNAKVSITTQTNAAVETGSTPKKSNDTTDRTLGLQKRVQRGDDEAFVELLDIWEGQGKL